MLSKIILKLNLALVKSIEHIVFEVFSPLQIFDIWNIMQIWGLHLANDVSIVLWWWLFIVSIEFNVASLPIQN